MLKKRLSERKATIAKIPGIHIPQITDVPILLPVSQHIHDASVTDIHGVCQVFMPDVTQVFQVNAVYLFFLIRGQVKHHIQFACLHAGNFFKGPVMGNSPHSHTGKAQGAKFTEMVVITDGKTSAKTSMTPYFPEMVV
jgi:hypothetical protein